MPRGDQRASEPRPEDITGGRWMVGRCVVRGCAFRPHPLSATQARLRFTIVRHWDDGLSSVRERSIVISNQAAAAADVLAVINPEGEPGRMSIVSEHDRASAAKTFLAMRSIKIDQNLLCATLIAHTRPSVFE
jgi:hypothetical protein